MRYLLKRTARAEGIKLSAEVYDKIIEIAQGGSRRALKLLAKVLYLDDDEERFSVLKSENASENEETIELCRALLKKGNSFSTLFGILKKIDVSDAEKVRQAVMGYMNSVLLNGKAIPEAISAMQAFGSADTYRNGKNALTIALLDYFDLLN
jgi:DNA polymerase III delta prime subunit